MNDVAGREIKQMKRNYRLLTTICLLAGLVLAGCNKPDAEIKADNKPVENVETAIVEETKQPVEAEIEPEEESTDTKVYRKFLDIVADTDPAQWDGFALIDLDGTETAEDEGLSDIEETEDESSDIDEVGEPYCGVLYWYKQLQESGKSWDEMEKYNSQTALVQHGWPYSTDNDEVRYVYQDITGDGLIELIITYHGDPVDIYSNDGDAVYAYGVPYRAIAEIYPDGTIMEGLTMGTKGWSQTWYRYDEDTFKYVPLKEKLTPDISGVTFPEGKRISDVVVPDGLDLID